MMNERIRSSVTTVSLSEAYNFQSNNFHLFSGGITLICLCQKFTCH